MIYILIASIILNSYLTIRCIGQNLVIKKNADDEQVLRDCVDVLEKRIFDSIKEERETMRKMMGDIKRTIQQSSSI